MIEAYTFSKFLPFLFGLVPVGFLIACIPLVIGLGVSAVIRIFKKAF